MKKNNGKIVSLIERAVFGQKNEEARVEFDEDIYKNNANHIEVQDDDDGEEENEYIKFFLKM